MRIISGRFKGRRLKAFDLAHIRPTTDRVKETLFNKLMFRLQGTRVLDLFAGTGNLGLEALSRGARHVTFVENHPASLGLIRANLELLNVDSSEFTIESIDVLQFLKVYQGPGFDIILIDPPFTKKIANTIMLALAKRHVGNGIGLIAIESGRHETLETCYPPFKLLDQRFFGDKTLSLYEVDSHLSG